MFVEGQLKNQCKTVIKQGQECTIPIQFKIDNYIITEASVEDIIIKYDKFKKSFKEKEITFLNNEWFLKINSNESARMLGKVIMQAKIILDSGDSFITSENEFLVMPTLFGEE